MTKKIKVTSSMRLQVITESVNGKETYKTVAFSGIDSKISDDDFMELAETLNSLMEYSLSNVGRVNSYSLVTE